MNKPLKIFLVAAGAAAGLLALAIAAVNLYLQSAGVQAKLREQLRDALRLDVTLAHAGWTPWGGATLSGLKALDARGQTILALPKAKIHPRLIPLLSGRVEIDEITLQSPAVTLSQDRDGKVAIPLIAKTKSAPGASPAPAGAPTQPPDTKPPRPEPILRALKLADGSFRLRDAKGREVVTLDGVKLTTSLETLPALSGEIAIAKLARPGGPAIDNLRGPFTCTGELIELPSLAGDIAGGRLTGHARVDLARDGQGIGAHVEFAGADVATLLPAKSGRPNRLTGRASGVVGLSGPTGDSRALRGYGFAWIEAGQLQQMELLQALGDALKVEELSRLELSDAHLSARYEGGETLVDRVVLQSPNLRLEAQGRVGRDSALDLDARLYLNRKIRKRLPDIAKENMVELAPDGYSYIDFKVGGTLDDPRSDLVEMMVGKRIQKEVGSVLGKLFGGLEDPKPKEKKPEP